jgi:hypothetical protein
MQMYQNIQMYKIGKYTEIQFAIKQNLQTQYIQIEFEKFWLPHQHCSCADRKR